MQPFLALDAVVRGGLLVMVSADGTSLEALSIETGAPRWQAPLGPPVEAAVVHELDPGVLLVQTPRQYVAVALSTGAVLSAREAPPRWEFVWRGLGGCGLGSSCALTPVSCADGRPLGPSLRGEGRYTHYSALAEDGGLASESFRCTDELSVLGAGGGWSVYQVGEQIAAFGPAGAHWRRDVPGCRSCAALGRGVSPDGRLCWTTERVTETELLLRAFSCADGSPAFASTLPMRPAPYEGVLTGWIPEPPSLLVATPGQAIALSPTGQPRWSRALPDGVMAAPTGLRLPSFPLALPFQALQRLDPATGEPLDRAPVPEGHEVRVAQDGSVQVVPQGLTFDRAGSPVPVPQVFAFVRDPAGSQALLAGKPVLKLPGDGWVLGEHASAAGTWLVVAQPRPGQPDLVHRLRAP